MSEIRLGRREAKVFPKFLGLYELQPKKVEVVVKVTYLFLLKLSVPQSTSNQKLKSGQTENEDSVSNLMNIVMLLSLNLMNHDDSPTRDVSPVPVHWLQ